VTFRHTIQTVLKRGALVAAANWPVTLIQSVADFLFKLLIAVPLVGGLFLVALVVGDEPGALFGLEVRDMAATIIASLMSHPLVLLAFLLAMAVVIIGGSLFVFLVKGGTVAVLVQGERQGGAMELPPLHWSTVRTGASFGVEPFIDASRALFPRYSRLGFMLMAAYLVSGGAYLLTVMASRSAGSAWLGPGLLTAGFVAWITLVNLMYLLVQIVIAADDCSVATAMRRGLTFLRHERRLVGGVFLVILLMVVFATGASFIATASLGLITFVPFLGPFLGLAVVPLQILAWLMREIVFEYIGLASVGAYVKLYREFTTVEGRVKATPTVPVLGSA
jgi:hypothetical protein